MGSPQTLLWGLASGRSQSNGLGVDRAGADSGLQPLPLLGDSECRGVKWGGEGT